VKRPSQLVRELMDHLPYTIFFGSAGVLFAGLLTYFAAVVDVQHAAAALASGPAANAAAHVAGHEHELFSGETVEKVSPIVFHVFHPVHLLFSAIATTAMFWRYDRKLWKALLTGFVGSAGVCGVSDIGLPYLGGWLLGTRMKFHWCLVQHPQLVVPFLVVGIIAGIIAGESIERSTVYSHSSHVFVSSVASIFYMISFGLTHWVDQVGYVFIIIVLAVLLPCCFSDIVFPLLIARRDEYLAAQAQRHGH